MAHVNETPEWQRLMTSDGTCQLAGVKRSELAKLALKELADNALDADPWAEVADAGGAYDVIDGGEGFADCDAVAEAFNIRRPMASTKRWRRPTRGALGNGLRVVAAVVRLGGGSLHVRTRGRCWNVEFHDDGTTSAVPGGDWLPCDWDPHVDGSAYRDKTAIRVDFGNLDDCRNTCAWSHLAERFRGDGPAYKGRTSAWWFDADELRQLAVTLKDPLSVRQFVEGFDGLTGKKQAAAVAKTLVGLADVRGMTAVQAKALLAAMRKAAVPVNPSRFAPVGAAAGQGASYRAERFNWDVGGRKVPVVVEVWASRAPGRDAWTLLVNRTPVAATTTVTRYTDKTASLAGAGFSGKGYALGRKAFTLFVNVTSPYVPTISTGKAPDLSEMQTRIMDTVERAVKGIKGGTRAGEAAPTQKQIILDTLDDAIDKTSSGGKYEFSLRQLYYSVRPVVMQRLGKESLDYNTFGAVIAAYEDESGEDIHGMYRDERGSLIAPHTGERVALGTTAVRDYERPDWTFSRILFCEKEGVFPTLIADGFHKRWDCALMSSKGFANRAAKDLLDKMPDNGQPIDVFCLHDADAAGGMIGQTLAGKTIARGARTVRVFDIGLWPWQGVRMGLEVEKVEAGRRRQAVAQCVLDRDADRGEKWADWLQSNRVEINAMTPAQLIHYLDTVMRVFGMFMGTPPKLVPPEPDVAEELGERVEEVAAEALKERILRDAGYDDLRAKLADRVGDVVSSAGNVRAKVVADLSGSREWSWRQPVKSLALDLGAALADSIAGEKPPGTADSEAS